MKYPNHILSQDFRTTKTIVVEKVSMFKNTIFLEIISIREIKTSMIPYCIDLKKILMNYDHLSNHLSLEFVISKKSKLLEIYLMDVLVVKNIV